jgi:long-chain acyl-CoA synthetase
MNTLAEVIDTVTRRHAKRTAVVDRETAVSYAELGAAIRGRAAALSRRGIRRGDRVAILLPNGLDFVTSFCAVVTAGGVAVPLNAQYQQMELRYFLRESGASLLMTAGEFAPLCHQVLSGGGFPCQLCFVEELPLGANAPATSWEEWRVASDPGAPVMYQFSSGSTGQPKRIARTHANLLFELNSLRRALTLTAEDRVLGVAPFSHVNGLMRSMLASLSSGATLYPLATFERHAVPEVIEAHRVSVFIGVPFMFSMLARTNFRRRPDLSSLRLCVSASAPMPRAMNQLFHRQFGMYVRQLYGSTETGTITVNLGADLEGTLESVGTPIPGVSVEVFTGEGRTARPDELGEVAVQSPAAIRGYGVSDQADGEVFRDGYFFTGDLGRKDQDGRLYLVGRKKCFINRGGYKVNPREIEVLLEAHPKVGEAVVVGRPTPYGDEQVAAVIVLAAPCTAEELVEFCRGKIADFKIPSVVEFRDSLPKTPTGKVQRGMLTPA